MKWWWRKKPTAPDKSDEAKAHLQRVLDREPEVKRVSHELREAQRKNHFSEMVNAAMTRVAREGN